ncbi:MAG: hypothetical protein IPM97_13930 [Bdellovibrionaceae bacterium]|nr:hypothetical protein [Pseudobdellovibrionaceae bacterium]
MSSELENYLTVALKRLEKAYKEVLKTQGYTAEAERIKILTEIVKEQGNHENTGTAAR